MNLHKLILTNNRCYKAGRTIIPKGIMVHSTGVNNPWLKRYVGPNDGLLGNNQYGNHWNNSNVDVCVHAFIGRLEDGSVGTYQTLPWNYRGWHAGGSANNTHISFEICEDGLTDATYFAEIYQEAVELCTYLCKLYGLTEKNIICHSEGHKLGIASGHADVMHWFPRYGKSMDTFRAAVKAQLNKGASTAPTQTEANTNATSQLYRVRKSWDDAKSQLGAFGLLENAKKACKAGYKVFDKNGNVAYDPAGATTSATTATAQEYPQFRDSTKIKGVKYKVTALSGLNMRAGAGVKNAKTGKENAIIDTLEYGSTVWWYGYYSTVQGVDWYWVKTEGGQTGFVSSQYLRS